MNSQDKQPKLIAVIGGGPAGLRAAEVAAENGAQVSVFESKPSVGRKFLVAGKSGLNLTHDSDFDFFSSQYSGRDFPDALWKRYLSDFDGTAMRRWAANLGVETFVAGGGKVFPVMKKAAPLLRRWVQALRDAGVSFQMNHRLMDLSVMAEGVEIRFATAPGVDRLYLFDSVILALGGGSWGHTGSDGSWVRLLEEHGVVIEPLSAANCGWECALSNKTLEIGEGKPLHNLKVSAGEMTRTGELLMTRYGFEGTPIYTLGRLLNQMETPAITIDFKPTFTVEHMVKKMESARRDFFKEARLRWKLSEAACALIEQFYGQFDSAESLAKVVKACRIPLTRSRPIDEAISSRGGVSWNALTPELELKQLPHVYCAGEMIDWEAPTGGFLMQGCFATGGVAGRAAARHR